MIRPINKPTVLLLARHGNTFGPGDVITRVGITDLPLVDSGLLQGRSLGIYLKQHHLIPDIIFTSKLKRTMQTAEQIQLSMQTKIPMQSLTIFNEIDYGHDENQPEHKVLARLGSDALNSWEQRAIVPSGWKVDPQEIINNWQLFAKKILEDYCGKTILVVTSNGIARFAPYLTENFHTFTQQYPIKIATGALCILEKKPAIDYWQCIDWNIKP
ncbi:MAG: histidine phosphatase family protein [bacterium]|nr:histidine phosphatase family protein [bacterium]